MEIKNWLDGEWALILGSSSGFGAEVSVKLSEYGVPKEEMGFVPTILPMPQVMQL